MLGRFLEVEDLPATIEEKEPPTIAEELHATAPTRATAVELPTTTDEEETPAREASCRVGDGAGAAASGGGRELLCPTVLVPAL